MQAADDPSMASVRGGGAVAGREGAGRWGGDFGCMTLGMTTAMGSGETEADEEEKAVASLASDAHVDADLCACSRVGPLPAQQVLPSSPWFSSWETVGGRPGPPRMVTEGEVPEGALLAGSCGRNS